MSELLNVYWGENFVGKLWLKPRGNFLFQYGPEWIETPQALPLSIRLPLKKEPYPDSVCHNFFSNLLPEGNVRMLIARKLGISQSNDFELLKALGGDCAGALSILPEEETASSSGDYELISPEELDGMILDPSRPLLHWKKEWRLSLAGAQQKLPVYYEGAKIYLPRGAYPSSHILKPRVPGFDQIIENEAFCMTLAKKLGLPIPEITILKRKQPLYLIERYDRKRDSQNRLQRLHQEDFCQALDHSYSRKYEAEGGPSLKDCFSLISLHGTQPIVDKKIFIQWILFNFFIGNCDGHAKNLSMLLSKEDYKLAPLYDLISTTVYPSLSAKFAMKIGGEDRPEWISRKNLDRLAQEAGVGRKAVISLAQEIGEKLPKLALAHSKEFVAQYGGEKIIKKICRNISSFSTRMELILEVL